LTPDAQLAEQGDAFAQYRLGKYYAKHRGRETPESISWYRKASTGLRRLAEAGNGQAMYVLGIMYAYGRGVARNTDEARHWLSLAVRQNVTEAQMVLASLEVKQTGSHQRKDRGPTHTAVP
jgi:TPR repeat protein